MMYELSMGDGPLSRDGDRADGDEIHCGNFLHIPVRFLFRVTEAQIFLDSGPMF